MQLCVGSLGDKLTLTGFGSRTLQLPHLAIVSQTGMETVAFVTIGESIKTIGVILQMFQSSELIPSLQPIQVHMQKPV